MDCLCLGTLMNVTSLISTKSHGQRVTKDWYQLCLVIGHQEVGGVTTSTVCMDYWCHQLPCAVIPLKYTAGRDASTVLELKPNAWYLCDPPTDPKVLPLQMDNVGTSKKPIYHGGGLLPSQLTCQT